MSARSSSFPLPFVLGFSLFACGGAVVGGGGGDSGEGKDAGGSARDANRPPSSDASPGIDAERSDGGSSRDGGVSHTDAVADTATPPPPPVSLATGTDLLVWGVTSDDFAIYSTATAASPTLYAVSLSGGSPITVDTLSAYSAAFVRGSVVVVLKDFTSSGGATLDAWTSKGGTTTLTATGFGNGSFGVSSDSQWITYFSGYDATAQTADAYVAKVDGSGAKLLQKAVAGVSYPTSCYPELGFVGPSVVLGYCAVPSTMTGTVYGFSQPSWKEVSRATSVYPYYTPDPAGKNVLVVSSAGLQVVAATGGSPTTIDATGQSAAFTSDGKDVVYVSYSGALLRSPVDKPSPTTLVSSGLEGILGLSPDDGTALVYEHYDSSTYLTDLYTASAVTPGSVTTLSSAQTAAVGGRTGIVSGSAFTADSAQVLYFTAVSTASYPYLGTLQSSSVGSSASSTLGTSTNTAFASGKTKAVFEDHYTQLAGAALATVDIESVDTSVSSSPKLVVASVNAGSYGSFFLSPDGTKIVYAQNTTAKTPAGVFVVAVP